MKAVICTRYGPPEVLQLAEVEQPTPADDEILIKIHATTVTSGDCRVRSFNVPPAFWLPGRLALGLTKPRLEILGSEFAGEVARIGKDVTRFKVGDAVFGTTRHDMRCYAEYRCLPETGFVAHKPVNLTYEQAAAVGFGGGTALNFLWEGKIQPGQKVLINGASGAVGTYAVQLAHHFGADVTAVCSTRNVELVTSLGANRLIDYTQEDFTKMTETYDIVFEVVGTTTVAQAKHLVKKGGYLLHAVMVMDEIKTPWFEMTTDIHVVGGTPAGRPDTLTVLKDLLESEQIKPVIDRSYPLDDIVEAHRYVDTGRKRGNVVITMLSTCQFGIEYPNDL